MDKIIRCYRSLVRMDLGAMAMKGYSPTDCLASYPGHSLGESYFSTEMQSVYSTALADWAIRIWYVFSTSVTTP